MLHILKRVTFSLLLIITMAGCSSKVKVHALMDMPSQSGVALNQLSIRGFTGSRYDINGDNIASKIKAKLLQEGYVDVASNAPVILVGKITPSRMEKNSWSEKHTSSKKTWYSYHASKTQSVGVNFAVISRNRTLASGSEYFTYSKEKSSNDGSSKAKSKLKSDAIIANTLMSQAATFVAQQISPYKTDVTLNFLNGDDDKLDLGIEYVKKTRYEQALSIFDQVANNTPSQEDRAKAIHNQGLIKLMQNKHQIAYELISQANLIDPMNMDILDSMKDVEDYKVLNDERKRQRGK